MHPSLRATHNSLNRRPRGGKRGSSGVRQIFLASKKIAYVKSNDAGPPIEAFGGDELKNDEQFTVR